MEGSNVPVGRHDPAPLVGTMGMLAAFSGRGRREVARSPEEDGRVLISKPVAEAIRDGRVTTQYRRWDSPRVKVGATQLTPAGVITFTRVTEVKELDRLSDRAARMAGMKDAAALRKALAPRTSKPSARGGRGGAKVYRVHVAWVGDDPRIAVRDRLPDAQELATIGRRLARLDASRSSGPWTRKVLEWIRDNPRVVSRELAALLGRELLPLKVDIRRLKALGLTISHEVGYELSPRGLAYLAWLVAESSGPSDQPGQRREPGDPGEEQGPASSAAGAGAERPVT